MSDEEIIDNINRNRQCGIDDLKLNYGLFFSCFVENVIKDNFFINTCLENVYYDIDLIIPQYDGTVCLATYINTYVREEILRLLNNRTIKVNKLFYSDIAKSYISKKNKHYSEDLSLSINKYLFKTDEKTIEFFVRRYYNLQSLIQIQRDMRIYSYKATLINKKIQFALKSNSSNILCAAKKMNIYYLDEFNKKIEFDYIKQKRKRSKKYGHEKNDFANFHLKIGLAVLLLWILLKIIAFFAK